MNPKKQTEGGTWLDWRDAWRAMGRTESEIESEELARDERYAAMERASDGKKANGIKRVGERLHGFSRKRFDARCERTARLAGYIVKALLRGWRRDPLTPRQLFNMAWNACFGDSRLASEGMARAWRDVWEWVRNIYAGLAKGAAEKGSHVSASYSQSDGVSFEEKAESSDGMCARDSKTGERPIKQPRLETAGAVCGAFRGFRERAAEPHSKENQRAEDVSTEPRIPRFKGKLPGRCCWKVWETMELLHERHWDATEHMWSSKHAFCWLGSVLAAGKSLRATIPLYYDVLIKWYGRQVSKKDNFVPSGMFAELYREAINLPNFNPTAV